VGGANVAHAALIHVQVQVTEANHFWEKHLPCETGIKPAF